MSSITHDIIIDTPEGAEKFVEALEEAERVATREDKRKCVADELNRIIADIRAKIPFFNLTDYYFAGGCIYSLWNNKEVKDYDIFCANNKAKQHITTYLNLHPELINCKTENAYTVGKYQFVIKHIGKPEDEVAKFDFKHNGYFYNNKGIQTVFGWDYIDSNELKFNDERARDVLNIVTRIPKFVKRGMEISQNEILNILEKGTRPLSYFSERKTIKKRRKGGSHY